MNRVKNPNPATRDAISDSGAQAHCISWRVINANRDLIQDIVPAPPQTGLTFGNNQSMATTHMARIGDYVAHATPTRSQTASSPTRQ